MEKIPQIIAPTRNNREEKDRKKKKIIDEDLIEMDAIIDGHSDPNFHHGQIVESYPRAGFDDWYPTEEDMEKFFVTHTSLVKQDIIFLRSLMEVDPFFRRHKMTSDQKKAYALIKNKLGELGYMPIVLRGGNH